jgi:endonuclease YncB( thermonuclease family)
MPGPNHGMRPSAHQGRARVLPTKHAISRFQNVVLASLYYRGQPVADNRMAKVVPLIQTARARKFRIARPNWRAFATICVVAISALIIIGAILPKLPDSRSVATISAVDVRVIDGDTISFKSIRYRLVGFDTPETLHAKCDSERTLGLQASARLRGLISSGEITLQEVRCSCPPGTIGTRYCNYGRLCGTLLRNGEDVGDILIREGLARPFYCSEFRCPKRQGWC